MVPGIPRGESCSGATTGELLPTRGRQTVVLRPPARVSVSFTVDEYRALRDETNVFADIAATLGATRARIDGCAVRAEHVTGNFFHVLGVKAALGRTLTPVDDEAGASVVVLSHRGWTRLFAAVRRSLAAPSPSTACHMLWSA